eukprot:scaffold25219_cov104-Skeletonema_dohrnii-CCMP3373.AAC.4
MALHFNVNLSCKHRSNLCDNADIVVPILIFFASSIKLQGYLTYNSMCLRCQSGMLLFYYSLYRLHGPPASGRQPLRIVGWVSLTTGSPSVVAMRTEVPSHSILTLPQTGVGLSDQSYRAKQALSCAYLASCCQFFPVLSYGYGLLIIGPRGPGKMQQSGVRGTG